MATIEQQRRYRRKIIIDTLLAYGGKCVECGSTDYDALEIDHEDGKGNEHRDALFGKGHASPGGWKFYLKLRQMGFPTGLGLVVRCVDCHGDRHPRGNPFGAAGRRHL